MKRILSLLLLLAIGLTAATAQTLNIHQGQLTTAIPASGMGDAQFFWSGTNFSAMTGSYEVAAIDSITTSRSTTEAATVNVVYATDGKAYVTVSGDVAPLLTISITGADVSIIASESLATEITYTLSGTSSDGSFYMDGSYKATFVLQNLNLTNLRGAPFTIDCGKRIDIRVPDGTTSTFVDCAGGSQSACFFVNGHAEFKGGGTLNIVGNTKHAYASDEYTWLRGSFGTMNITAAANDGLHIKQYFQMDGGTLNVSGTKGDCIDVSATKDATDELNGQAIINAGTITMSVAADDVKGLKTENSATLAGGSVTAEVSGLGTKGFSIGTDLTISQKTEVATSLTMNVTGTTYMPGDDDLESKCRGVKVKGNFTFDGGTISMSVTGKKAKGISVDGTYTYVSGTTNVLPE